MMPTRGATRSSPAFFQCLSGERVHQQKKHKTQWRCTFYGKEIENDKACLVPHCRRNVKSACEPMERVAQEQPIVGSCGWCWRGCAQA